MEIVIFWTVLSIIVAVYARRLNRTGLGWFVLALLASPLLAWLALLALGRNEPEPSSTT